MRAWAYCPPTVRHENPHSSSGRSEQGLAWTATVLLTDSTSATLTMQVRSTATLTFQRLRKTVRTPIHTGVDRKLNGCSAGTRSVRAAPGRLHHLAPPLALYLLRLTRLRKSHPHWNAPDEILPKSVAAEPPDRPDDRVERHRRVLCAGLAHQVRQVSQQMLGDGHDGFRVIALG